MNDLAYLVHPSNVEQIQKEGFKVIGLKGDAVFRLKARVFGHLKAIEDFDSENFVQDQVNFTKHIHQCWEWKEIIEDNAFQITALTGIENIIYQKEPYLRIARPNQPEDNIGIHRDTHYGASDKEWVLWVPLTNAIQGGELRILPESHTKDDDYYPWTKVENPEVTVGSDKHWLGFRYAPKVMEPETEARCIPIPCYVGCAILFNCACVHGQKVNQAPWTRFSLDIRLSDRDADIQKTRGMHGEIYAEL